MEAAMPWHGPATFHGLAKPERRNSTSTFPWFSPLSCFCWLYGISSRMPSHRIPSCHHKKQRMQSCSSTLCRSSWGCWDSFTTHKQGNTTKHLCWNGAQLSLTYLYAFCGLPSRWALSDSGRRNTGSLQTPEIDTGIQTPESDTGLQTPESDTGLQTHETDTGLQTHETDTGLQTHETDTGLQTHETRLNMVSFHGRGELQIFQRWRQRD